MAKVTKVSAGRGRYVRGEAEVAPLTNKAHAPTDQEFRMIAGYCYHLVSGMVGRLGTSKITLKWQHKKGPGWVHEIRYGEIPLGAWVTYDDTVPLGRIDLSPAQEAELRGLGLPATACVPLTLSQRERLQKKVAIRLDDYFNVRNFEVIVKYRALLAKQTGA